MEGMITITKKEYLNLRIDSERLARLENGGVDNWDWYGDSLNPEDEISMHDWEELEAGRISAL